MQTDWPLTGRGRELEQLRVALTTPGHRGIVLAGAAGLGKTRLATEGLHLAESLGLATARVSATRAARAIPFGAIAPLLPVDQPGTTGDQAAFLRRATIALAHRGHGSALVLFVDDAHLLDDASATLVHQLATTQSAFVLATVRAGEIAPDPIVALWKDRLLDRIDLAGLDVDAIGQLLTSVLAGPIDSAATAELARHCEGNVLFLRELVLGSLDAGALRADSDLWRLIAPLSPSNQLVELVEARLSDLNAEERSLLEVVAIGEPLGHAELNALSDPVLAERLERKSLVTGSRNQRRLEVRLAHPIYGDVLRSRIPPLRTASVSRVLAEVVESWGARRREDTLRVATWRLDGGGGSAEFMLKAAVLARWRYDFPLAERLVNHAMAAGGGFESIFLAAQIAGLKGDGTLAEALLNTLDPSNDDERGRIAITRFDNIAFHFGDIEGALRIASVAEAELADPTWKHEIAGRRSALLLATTGPRAAAEPAVALLDKAEGSALVWACQVAAFSLGRLGRLDAALAASERGHNAHGNLTEPIDWYPLNWHPWVQIFNACEIHAHSGRLIQAEALALKQYDDALAQRSVEAQAWFAWQLARVLGQRGHLDRAVAYGREAIALFDQLGRPLFKAFCLAHLAPILSATGNSEHARDAVTELEALRSPDNLLMATDMILARAWLAVADGDLPAARSLLLQTVELARSIGDYMAETTALHDLCRIGHHPDAAERLQELTTIAEGPMVAAKASHALALSVDDPQQLEDAEQSFAAMGADLLAAEAAADAAVSWRRKGAHRESTRASQRAALLTDRCPGAATPALQSASARVTLTHAERQAALLAASGRTTKAIAAELNLSARTVSNQLQQAYSKLGINGRAELAASLAPDTPYEEK